MNSYSGESFRKMPLLLCAALVLTASADVFARTRTTTRSRGGGGFSRRSTVAGPGGRSATRDSSVVKTEDGYSRSSAVTGPQGNTATREAQGHWDPETGTWSKSATVTGADGQTAERSSTVTKTDDGYVRSGTATDPQGNSATRESQGHWDPVTKTWTKTTTVTGNEKQEETE